MNITDWIATGSLFVALVAFIIQQTRVINASRRSEERTETKLTIYYVLQEGDRTEKKIVEGVRKAKPTRKVSEPEISIALYEMLRDGTIRYTRKNKYKVRRRKPSEKGAAEESDDDD